MKEEASKSSGKARRAVVAVRRGIHCAAPRSLQAAVYLMAESSEVAASAVSRLNSIFARQNLIFRWMRTEQHPHGMLLIRNNSVGVWILGSDDFAVTAARFPDFTSSFFATMEPRDALLNFRKQLVLTDTAHPDVPTHANQIVSQNPAPEVGRTQRFFQIYRG